MVSPFELLVNNLNQLGFFGFVLPWILTFTIFYGLLLKSKALGEDQKIIGVVSLVAGFFVIGFSGVALGTFLSTLFGTATMIIAGILVTLMFIALSGYDVSKLAESKYILIGALSIGIIVFISLLGVNITNSTLTILFVVILMIVSVLFIFNNGKWNINKYIKSTTT